MSDWEILAMLAKDLILFQQIKCIPILFGIQSWNRFIFIFSICYLLLSVKLILSTYHSLYLGIKSSLSMYIYSSVFDIQQFISLTCYFLF